MSARVPIAAVAESPVKLFAKCLLGEEATERSHRSLTNMAKNKQA